MKRIILAILIAWTPIMAKESSGIQNPFFQLKEGNREAFLLDSMPHFMGMYMKHGGMHKIKPTESQEIVLEKQFGHMVKIIMSTKEKIGQIENEIVSKVIFDGKTETDMASKLDEISKLKRELTNLQIECLNVFKKTLTKEQYQMMIDMAIEHAKEHK